MISRKLIACLTTVLCLCLLKHPCLAQDRDKVKHVLGKVSPADFKTPSTPIIDSNTHAVVLSDEGEVHYIGNSKDWFSRVYTRQTKILILNKSAFSLSTNTIGLPGSAENGDKISNLQAATYNLENGQIIETKLDPKDVFVTAEGKRYKEAKFTFPGVKEGSIIEYTYTTISEEYPDELPEWKFQWERYPCLFSDYKIEVPETMSFVFMRQGVHAYSVDKGSTSTISYPVIQKNESGLTTTEQRLYVTATAIKHDWALKDLPAFGDEVFLTTPENYLDKISFQLSGHADGERTYNYHDSWKAVNAELLGNSRFGATLDDEDEAVGRLAEKISDDGDERAKAKAVYYYVSQHYTCTNYFNFYLRSNFQDVIKTNNGTVGDINLLLIALLRKKHLHADPVLLSTREFGFNMVSYPILEKLNYVIVRLNLSGTVYYLDATRPQLGFGQLAANCYNGHARVISNRDSSSIYFWADSLKESKVTMVLLSASEKGMEGTLESTPGPQESYQIRRDVAEHGEQQYFKDIQTSWGADADISNGGIDSLTRLEDPVKIHYDFLLKQPPGASVLYFDPMMRDDWRENPFKAADRKYPVEIPYVLDHTYVFSMDMPEGYVVDELPKSAKVALNGDQGYFEYLIQQQGEKIQMRCRVRLSKAQFPPEDYSSLRDFFAFIVKKENEQIVLKKK
jgi:hypothetical protein